MSKKERDKERYQKNKALFLERSRLWRLKNPERAKEITKRAHERAKSDTPNYRRMLDVRSNRQRLLKIRVLEFYSKGVPFCVCCGDEAIEFLSLDHIDGKGGLHRKQVGSNMYKWIVRNNFPSGIFRVLCMNCNFARGNYGYCPHDEPTVRNL